MTSEMAIRSAPIFNVSRMRGWQNSEMKTAAPMPHGIAMAIASAVTDAVPATSARIPY